MKKLTSLLLTIPLALSLSCGRYQEKTISTYQLADLPQLITNEKKNSQLLENNPKEIRMEAEVMGGHYIVGTELREEISGKPNEPISVIDFYLTLKQGKDTMDISIGKGFNTDLYVKDLTKILLLKDSLKKGDKLSLVKATINEEGDTLYQIIPNKKSKNYTERNGFNYPSQIKFIK
jgi:hypothetical protein